MRWCITILSKFDFLTVPKSFVGEPFIFQKNFLSKKFMARTGISRFSLETLLSHSTEKIRRGTLVFQKFSGLKKLHKMVYHDFVEHWFSHSTGNIRRGTLHYSEKIFYRKILWIGGGYQDFLSKLLGHSTGIIRRGNLVFQKNFWIKKIAWDGVSQFCRIMFFSQYRKIS